MIQLTSLLVSVILFSSGRKTFSEANGIHQNLYIDEKSSNFRTLSKSALGVLNFLIDGEVALSNELKESTPSFGQEYDFIVVGAGSSGATIASRLSEMENVMVLLIEAGSNENLLMDIPILVNYLQFSDDLNWKYQTEPSEKFCLGMTDKRCKWPRGKVMGGSSVLNYMIATRGSPIDYDTWASTGNEGWSYNELLKYFKKLEDIGITEYKEDNKMHNVNGPVHIAHPPYRTPLAKSFLEAGVEMGYPIVDHNSNKNIGFSYIQSTIKNGTRVSTNKAYLYPANRRKNLFVTRLSHVNKILIHPRTKRAYGVQFTKSGIDIEVKAKKEIILSAGTIGSAQLLMLSGIGPFEHLKEMNINVIEDLPVGDNLMDHIAYGGLIFTVDQPVSIATKDLADPLKPYISEFLLNRRGPLTVPGACEALAFINTDDPQNLEESYPNLELLFIGGSMVSDLFFRYNIGISNEYWAKTFENISGHYSWTIFPMLMQPKSRGKIRLRNKNPKAKPKIFANYLDHPEDIKIMIKGIRAAIEVGNSKSMRRFNSKLYDISIPGCEHYQYDSDEYWECAIRTFTFTIYHYSGTCKMAPDYDATGVVNPRLQVKGIKGLRVGDASIMPQIITGHTNIPAIMIGEKLADMIKEDWNFKKET